MVFFGWGRDDKVLPLDPEHALVLSYRYFHLLWLFRISFETTYGMATRTPQGWATRPISEMEATAIGARGALVLHWWWRWGLLLTIGAVVLAVVVAARN